ncbi:protein of unknown function [Magnetospirillum sp. XM-1]|nr:protein of unknown function [Magnetospirillum sp. XM-1]
MCIPPADSAGGFVFASPHRTIHFVTAAIGWRAGEMRIRPLEILFPSWLGQGGARNRI